MGQESILDPSMVELGRIGAPHGVKGWVRVHSFTDPADNILNYRQWHVYLRGHCKIIEVLEIQPQRQHYIARLKGYEDRDSAASLTNAEFAVPRTELPPLSSGEYYWMDLIGMTVINETGETLGVIERLFETGSNDVLVVKGETREHYIPYIPEDYVLEVNLESRIMRVSWDPEF